MYVKNLSDVVGLITLIIGVGIGSIIGKDFEREDASMIGAFTGLIIGGFFSAILGHDMGEVIVIPIGGFFGWAIGGFISLIIHKPKNKSKEEFYPPL
jgi:hypothetical protein